MIKAYDDRKNDRTVVQIKGDEKDILFQLHLIIKEVYKELSVAGKKTVIENWDSLYRPDLSEKEAALKSIANIIKNEKPSKEKEKLLEDFVKSIENYIK